MDRAIYPVPAALAAGYKLSDRAFVWLQSAATEGHYLVFLRPKRQGEDLAALSGVFANELLDQALRERLEERFAPLRTLIAAEAFAEGNLLDVVSRGEQPEQHESPV